MTKKTILTVALGGRAVLEAPDAAVEGWEVCRAATLADARRQLKARPFALGLLLASGLLVLGGSVLGRGGPSLALKLSGAAIAATGVMLVATV